MYANKQPVLTVRRETCAHIYYAETVATVFPQLLHVLLLMPTCHDHLSPLSIVVTSISLAPLLTDVPSVDHTLIL